jgi:hypothetical protein
MSLTFKLAAAEHFSQKGMIINKITYRDEKIHVPKHETNFRVMGNFTDEFFWFFKTMFNMKRTRTQRTRWLVSHLADG